MAVRLVCVLDDDADVQVAMREICKRGDVARVTKVIPGINDKTVLEEE